jgi:lysophospholipase L1-like esterase
MNPALRAILLSPPKRSFKNFKESNTRNFRAGLTAVRTGTGRLTIACLGDSTTAGTGAGTGTSGLTDAYVASYPVVLAGLLNTQLAATINDAVWGRLSGAAVSYSLFDPRLSLGSGWGVSGSSIGGIWNNTTTTDPLAFTPADAFDTIDVYYVRNTGNATFTVDVDGGAALATVNAAGGLALLKQAVTCSKATHTVNIKRNGTGAGLSIVGIDTYDSTAPKVSMWNWGSSGTTAANWASTSFAFSPANAIATIAPDLMIYGIGINDMGTSDIAQFKTDVQTVVTKQLIAGDCIIAIPNPVSTGSYTQAQQDAIKTALLEVAATNDLPVIDRTKSVYGYVQGNDPLDLFYDVLHLSANGYAVVADQMREALMYADRW